MGPVQSNIVRLNYNKNMRTRLILSFLFCHIFFLTMLAQVNDTTAPKLEVARTVRSVLALAPTIDYLFPSQNKLKIISMHLLKSSMENLFLIQMKNGI